MFLSFLLTGFCTPVLVLVLYTRTRLWFARGFSSLTETYMYMYVGVIITKDLSWSDQYKYISGRAYKLRTWPAEMHVWKLCLNYYQKIIVSFSSKVTTSLLFSNLETLLDKSLERIQRRATRFIVNNSKLNYKERLEALHLLPLTMWFELIDIMFFIKQLKNPTTSFNIL